MKEQAVVNHLAKNPIDEEYEPLKTYFPDEEISCIDKLILNNNQGWKLFFDGASNKKGVGIGVVLMSESGEYYPITAQLRFYCTNNMSEYEACIFGFEEEFDGNPWFHDIKTYLQFGECPSNATRNQKRTIWRLASRFFLSGGILYKKTHDLGLLKCVNAKEASTIMIEVHLRVCGPRMNGYVLAKNLL
ncbi:hypothetical protein R3W88_026787 [Solanum pinnatisectum]|uniref:RNase H type-1 domain-containing protein n=1 Tax=Solanum pinnatisectum TaxID=50273 RepID=A0AAV9LEW3_9SOLN|nr:hypothetical protein R3W88_026787 [Solanum pinnatisectum]